MEIEPGRGLILDSDEADASLVMHVAQALEPIKDLMGTSIHDRALKEVIWFKWEQPRLPRPLIDGKYPCAYPWSALARETYRGSPKKLGRAGLLVIEHVVPKREMMALIAERLSALTAESMAQLLHDGCRAVVITKDEDRELTRAGLGHRRANLNDVWSRYREGGLHLSTFAPLEV